MTVDRGGSLLRLQDGDNVAMATRNLEAGEEVRFGDQVFRLGRRVPTGHKVAIRPIAAGERVVKFRVPIGSAITAIAPGEYVHTHNIKSDYIATFTFEKGKQFEEGKA
ncbi:MAG: UxaA family hydrolase [Alphaproteobacteria bacterium]|nr:UxaA family hydrolase [Alphaproteobacteria bacterium]